jgi:F-type H+-transporting ATPase subunit delta
LDQTTTDQILSKVKELIGTDKTIQLDTHIDASIIGGFIIQFGDNLYDSSVAYQLAKLKQSFSHNS